jgi:amyloid beta precursor protein binding protein 1
MKAVSNDYISLQNIYKAKARADLAEVTSHIRSLEETLNRPNPITTAEIEAFCKNAPFVKLILGKQLHIPREPGRLDCTAEYADSVLRSLDMEDSLMPLYLSYLALDYHIDTEGPLTIIPPTDVTALESQQRKLKWSMTQYTETLIEKLRKVGTVEMDAESAQERISEVIMELARAGGSELHNISAFTGGMVAQEVIKVVTKQYVPVDNTCLFDGVTSRTGVLRV